MKNLTTIDSALFIEKSLQKLDSFERERLQYAKARWEFLRRNKEFAEAIRLYKSETISDYIDTYIYVISSYKLAKDGSLALHERLKKYFNPDYSFEDLATMFATEGMHREESFTILMRWVEAMTSDFSSGLIVMIKEWGQEADCPFEILRPRTYNQDPEYVPQELINTGVLELSVDFKVSKKKLLSDFKTLIDMYKPHAPKQRKARKSHSYDSYPLYLKAYDLRIEKKLTYKEIAQTLMPGPYKTDPKSAQETVRNHCKEAERLIKNVANF